MEHVRFDESGELRLDADSSDHRDARWGVVYRGSEAWVQQAGTDAQVPWKPGALEALGRPDHVTVDDAGVVFASWGTTLARLVDSGAAVTWEAPRARRGVGRGPRAVGDEPMAMVRCCRGPTRWRRGARLRPCRWPRPPTCASTLRADLPPPPADAAGPRLRRAGDGWVPPGGRNLDPPGRDAVHRRGRGGARHRAGGARSRRRAVDPGSGPKRAQDPGWRRPTRLRSARTGGGWRFAATWGWSWWTASAGSSGWGWPSAEASTRRRSADAWELRFSDDSRRLYLDRQWVWTVPDGDMVLQRGMGPIRHLAVSRDGRVLAVASEREVVLVDTDDPEHPVWFHDVRPSRRHRLREGGPARATRGGVHRLRGPPSRWHPRAPWPVAVQLAVRAPRDRRRDRPGPRWCHVVDGGPSGTAHRGRRAGADATQLVRTRRHAPGGWPGHPCPRAVAPRVVCDDAVAHLRSEWAGGRLLRPGGAVRTVARHAHRPLAAWCPRRGHGGAGRRGVGDAASEATGPPSMRTPGRRTTGCSRWGTGLS